MTHGKTTRPYMTEGNPYAKQNCWMFDRKKISIDVDVVMTCYKRPQVLTQQLAAIKNQTLAPSRLFLYQDGIDGYYKIELNDRILSEFDACKISAKNCGVWKRFEFAEEIAKSPYVCLFDDDTIPGARWFENCHMNMMQIRGVYGTNGVLLKTIEGYPRDYFNAGWYKPNKKTCAVDFVGHSWFVEREALTWMLAKPWRGKYKLVAEDMTLSVAASEHGVGTYTPQHPKQIPSLWGSLPNFGLKYGTNEVAISINPANLNAMTAAIKEIRASGWKHLLEKNPGYLEEFFGAREQQPPSSGKKALAQLFKLPLPGKKFSIFLGEQKYSASVCKLFGLSQANYKVFVDEKNQIDIGKLFSFTRRDSVHVFFTDAYELLKPYLEKAGMKTEIDFADGRGLVAALN